MPNMKASALKRAISAPTLALLIITIAICLLSVWYLIRPQPLIIQGEADATRIDVAARIDGDTTWTVEAAPIRAADTERASSYRGHHPAGGDLPDRARTAVGHVERSGCSVEGNAGRCGEPRFASNAVAAGS